MEMDKMVGTTPPNFTFTVEKGKIKEMALALGDLKEVYFDTELARSQGHRDVIAPPTFGMCIDLWGGPGFPELCHWLGMNMVKVLHGEQEFKYYGDICAGDQITVTTSLKGRVEKDTMTICIVESAYTNQLGRLVLKSVKTILERK